MSRLRAASSSCDDGMRGTSPGVGKLLGSICDPLAETLGSAVDGSSPMRLRL